MARDRSCSSMEKIKMTDAIKEYSGLDVMSMSDEELKKQLKNMEGRLRVNI